MATNTQNRNPMKTKRPKAGRPPVVVDEQRIIDLCARFCTKEEIAHRVGIHVSTLYRQYKDVLEKGVALAKSYLRDDMHKAQQRLSVPMLIWLSKQHLGYRDPQPEEVAQSIIHIHVNENP